MISTKLLHAEVSESRTFLWHQYAIPEQPASLKIAPLPFFTQRVLSQCSPIAPWWDAKVWFHHAYDSHLEDTC